MKSREGQRRSPQISRWLLLGAASVLVAGCFGNRAIPDVKQEVELPEQFARPPVEEGVSINAAAPKLNAWCSDFGQQELDGLVDQAFEGNLNLMASWARLDQSMAVARQSRATLFPSITADASAGANRQLMSATTVGPNGQPTFNFEPDVVGNYRISIGASYEVDLWGKLAAQREAAALDVEATRADIEVIAFSLTSQVAEAWFDVLAQRQKRDLVEEQIELNERYVELLELRLAQGQGSALDINQQLQQIEQLRSQIETITQAEVLAMQRLAILVGKPPSAGMSMVPEGVVELPELPALPDAGVPADLLERRPDLRRSYKQLEAANRRIAVAVRDRLPTVRLSPSLFLQAIKVGDLLDEIFWSATAAISQPLVDGGRRAAEVERAEAAQRQAYYTYANTLLTALQEVEGALVSEHYQRRFIDELVKQKEIATVTLELSRERYSAGSIDFLRVLTALQSLQQIEQNLVDAKRRQLSNRIQLCRALGGTWTRDLEAPTPDEEGVRYE